MKRFKMLFGLGILLVLSSVVTVLIPIVARGDVPKLINFQGILRDGSGNPVPDAVYVIRFRIYDDSTAGANLWEEFDDVQTTDGLFNVRLGDTTDLPAGLFEGSVNRFVGVKVGGDPEAAPRTRLISVPYAFHALNSDSAATASVALDLTCAGCVDAGDLAANSVGSDEIANASITSADMGASSVVGGLGGSIFDGTITIEDLGTNSVAADEIAAGAVGTSEIDATQVQRRVTGTAGANQYITAINQDGSVVTASDQVGTASGWTDDGAIVRLSTGTDNVGIGTVAPQSNLHIFQDVNNSVGLRIDNPNVGGAAQERIDFGSSGLANISVFGASNRMSIVNNRPSGAVEFEVGGSQRFFISNSGNVGIGTTGPNKKLEVAGSIKGDTVFSNVLSSSSPLRLNAPAATTRMYINDINGNVGIGTTSPAGRLTVNDNLPGIPSGTPAIHLGAPTTGTTEFVQGKDFANYLATSWNDAASIGTINASLGKSLILQQITGNKVGIGTTSPTKKLEVAGSIKVGTNDTVFSSNISSNSPLSLQAPAGTTRAYVDDVTGNVGIGTSTPTSNLHIFQDVNNSVGLRIDNPNVGGAAQERIDFGSSGLANITVFGGSNGMSIVNNRTSGLIDFETGGTTRVRIANNGRVAIGTVSQQNTLDVGGNAAIGASFAGTGAPANGLLVEGNVGIGTTSPTTRLQVVGGQISADAGTPAAPGYAFAGDLNTGFYGFGDFLSFITGGTQRGYIAPDGRFVMETRAQIGTTIVFGSPSTLYVEGSIASGITTVVGSTTLTNSNSVVLVNTGTATITLPAAAAGATGRQYSIKKISATAGTITIDGNLAETIDGATTHSLTAQYEYVVIVSNGTSWFVVADN